MNSEDSLIDFGSVNLGLNEKDPISYYWSHPSMIQIMGNKGSGKTALALKICKEFAKANSSRAIRILNCAGGITANRLKSLSGLNYEYFDIFSVEDLQDLMNSTKESKKSGLLFLDGVSSIIMGASQRIGLG